MNKRGDLDKLNGVPYKVMINDLTSQTPVILKAKKDFLAQVAFKDDDYYPDTKLPYFVHYEIPLADLGYLDNCQELSADLKYFFGVETIIDGVGDGNPNLIISGHLHNNKLRNAIDFHIQNCYATSPGGKSKYFEVGTHKEKTPIRERKEVLYFNEGENSILTNEFIQYLTGLGLRYNQSLGAVTGLEEMLQLRGLEFGLFVQDVLHNPLFQKLYHFEVCDTKSITPVAKLLSKVLILS